MTDPDKYLTDGTLIDYSLGLLNENDRLEMEIALELYPQLKEELRMLQDILHKYLRNKPEASAELKERIWATLQNISLEKYMNLQHLPLINKYSNHKSWMDAVSPLLPKKLKAPFYARPLTNTKGVTQVLIMSGIDIPDEVHEDELESFILLEGECECHVGERIIKVSAGGYLEIPLHQHHDVKILSEYIVGVMQRIAL
jgi:mannose-6-phosphate isomerase-like protein (cupin superfamily)